LDEPILPDSLICGTGTARGQLTALQKVECLRHVDLFSHATVEELVRLAAISAEVHFRAGDMIFGEGDIGDALYVVIRGRVSLTRGGTEDNETVSSLRAFGTYSVLTREPRYFTAKVLEDTFALRIDAEDFFDLLSHNMEIVVGIFKLFARKMGVAVF